MSDLPQASRGADQRTPPRVVNGTTAGTNFGALTATTMTGAALAVDTGVKQGGAYFSFQANGGTAYVRFRADNAAGTSAANGYEIPQDQTAEFWLSPFDRYADLFGAAGTVRWWQSSPNYDARP